MIGHFLARSSNRAYERYEPAQSGRQTFAANVLLGRQGLWATLSSAFSRLASALSTPPAWFDISCAMPKRGSGSVASMSKACMLQLHQHHTPTAGLCEYS